MEASFPQLQQKQMAWGWFFRALFLSLTNPPKHLLDSTLLFLNLIQTFCGRVLGELGLGFRVLIPEFLWEELKSHLKPTTTTNCGCHFCGFPHCNWWTPALPGKDQLFQLRWRWLENPLIFNRKYINSFMVGFPFVMLVSWRVYSILQRQMMRIRECFVNSIMALWLLWCKVWYGIQ